MHSTRHLPKSEIAIVAGIPATLPARTILDAAGLPRPVPNYGVVVDGEQRFLDVAWPHPMVDLEFDGFDPHMVRSVFDDDRVRQNALVTAGWTVLRATSDTLRNRPDRLVAALRAALQSRGHEISPTSEVS